MLCANNRFGVCELWLRRWLSPLEKLLFSQLYFVARIFVFFIIERNNFLLILLKVAPSCREIASGESALSLHFDFVFMALIVCLWLLDKVWLVIHDLSSELHACCFHIGSSKAMIAVSWVASAVLRVDLFSLFSLGLHFDPEVLLELFVGFTKARLLGASDYSFFDIFRLLSSGVVLILVVQLYFVLNELVIGPLTNFCRGYFWELILHSSIHGSPA